MCIRDSIKTEVSDLISKKFSVKHSKITIPNTKYRSSHIFIKDHNKYIYFAFNGSIVSNNFKGLLENLLLSNIIYPKWKKLLKFVMLNILN